MQLRKRVQVMKSFSVTAAVLAVFALPFCMTNLHAAVPGSMSQRARRGEVIFQQRCAGCHHKQPGDTTPFGPPNLHESFRRASPLTTKEAVDIIANGKGTMPGWGKVLSKSDIDDVIAYLKTH